MYETIRKNVRFVCWNGHIVVHVVFIVMLSTENLPQILYG